MSKNKQTLRSYEVLEAIHNKKEVKQVTFQVPYLKDVYLTDLSIQKKFDEDLIYSKDQFLRYNIRRGNTICEIKNKDKITFWARYAFPLPPYGKNPPGSGSGGVRLVSGS